MASATSFYDMTPLDKSGKDYPLAQHKGKVVLVVNTASKCGFTSQFKGLEELYTDIKEKHPDDFMILGFPCNQFGSQDPGSNDEIQEFCQVNYGVTFPVLGKINVKDGGDGKASPLFEWLTTQNPGRLSWMIGNAVKWNFEKFLIGREGQVLGRWRSITSPASLKSTILQELEREKEKKENP